jgi:hypothetical protein
MRYAVALNMRRNVRFDHVAALLVGTLAVVGAVLISLQMTHDHASSRAGSQGARLATDIATRIAVSSTVFGWEGEQQQQAIALGVAGLGRSMAGLSSGSTDDQVVGEADTAASQQLQDEITRMAATTTNPPLDAYAAGLVSASVADIQSVLEEQNRQVAIADEEGGRSRVAVLGITFTALGGVLAGLGVALKETRPGWAILALGWVVAGLAILCAMLAAF